MLTKMIKLILLLLLSPILLTAAIVVGFLSWLIDNEEQVTLKIKYQGIFDLLIKAYKDANK